MKITAREKRYSGHLCVLQEEGAACISGLWRYNICSEGWTLWPSSREFFEDMYDYNLKSLKEHVESKEEKQEDGHSMIAI
jgi:hypothetical protein